MAKTILATTPLSYNDINSLAQLFSNAFIHLNEPDVISEQAQQKHLFYQQVHIVVGMAFTAALVEQDSLALFSPYLKRFLRHRVNDGNRFASATAGVAMGDIISLGSDAFRTLDHPEYYSYFVQALRNCLRYLVNEFDIPKFPDMNKVIALIAADD